jgi:hypothetical protein
MQRSSLEKNAMEKGIVCVQSETSVEDACEQRIVMIRHGGIVVEIRQDAKRTTYKGRRKIVKQVIS